jgi:hypothetical protein
MEEFYERMSYLEPEDYRGFQIDGVQENEVSPSHA